MKNNTMKSPKVITKTKKCKSVISSICIVALLLSFSVVLLLGSNLSVYASYDDNEKIPCNATLEDSFSEDRVLVILSSEASSSSHIYDKDDFNIEKCESVTDLSGSPNTGSASNNNKTSFKRVLSLELADSSKEYVLEVISELIERDDVIYAGPDYEVSALSTMPNDTYVDTQWAINSLSLRQVWDFTTGSNEVLVGILDSGIDGNHPDLADSIVTSLCRDFTSGEEEGVAVDEVTDPNGHGTHVAGIIGAGGNNNLGVVGANWNVGLVSLRVLDNLGNGNISYVAKAIRYAGENNIPILNISAGWYEHVQEYDVVIDTVISNYSGLVVCAAGNHGRDNDNDDVENNGYPMYPASYSCDNIISVGSINQYDERSVFDRGSSNYGAISVDVYAPGSDILSTYPDEKLDSNSNDNIPAGYCTDSGTSMAAPYVAGIAALLLSVDPDLTTSELKYAIINSSETITISVPSGTQDVKKVNALSALRYVINLSTTFLHLEYDEGTVSKTIDGTSTYFIENNAMIRLVVGNEYNYNFEASSDYPINVALYDYDLDLISTDVVYSNENCDAEFCENLSLGTYYLRISYVNETTSGTININIHGPSHQHSYTEWIYYDRISHIEVCECGTRGTRIEAHVVSQADLFKPRARCLGCNALLNLNGDIGIVPGTPLSINRSIVTENGSFILPSGIIVLVEEDIEAYLNGTLIFYDEGETLVTQ